MSGLLWKLNRLRVMTFGEILFRLYRIFLTWFEQKRVLSGWKPLPDKDITYRTALFGLKLSSELEAKLLMNFKQNESELENNLAGKIKFFGHDLLDIGHPVKWHCEPVTGITSPLVFGKTLNYRNDDVVGNVKFLWELGRHQHLVPLAVAYVATGDQKYRVEIGQQLTSWLEQNPFGMGIHWCSSLEASLRITSWALVHSLLVLRDGEQGVFALVDKVLLGTSIYQHMYFIRHFLSLHSSANNHLIGELTGLWVGCTVFDLGFKGNKWASFSRAELEKQARLQVYDDGVDREQATYYHLWVLEYFLFVWLTGRRTGEHFSSDFIQNIYSMLFFLRDIAPDKGEPPQIGDADDGFVARFDPIWPELPYKEMINACEYALGLSSDSISQKSILYGEISDIVMKPEENQHPSWNRKYPSVYQEGGYAILGNDSCHIVMDAGNLGYLGIAAHGHADALSLCLAIDGEWWIVDPGTYAYHSDQKWRNYFRGTSSHNTIIVNSADQSTIAGPFMWTQKAEAHFLHVRTTNDHQIAVGQHNGYKRFAVSHQRTIDFNGQNNQLEIIDELNGGSNMKINIHFHFHPLIQLSYEVTTNSWIATRRGSDRELVLKFDEQWETDVVNGANDPILGWYSPSLEQKIPVNTLRGSAMYSEYFHSEVLLSVR